MNRRITAALLLVIPAMPSVLVAAPEVDVAIRATAADWLQKVDAADYAASWVSAASMFKAAVTAQAWEKAAQSVRSPLGPLRKRVEKSSRATNSLPGVPHGKYVVMQYDTEFENKPVTVETLTLVEDQDGLWYVAGYFIK